jgi:hypothetical protein
MAVGNVDLPNSIYILELYVYEPTFSHELSFIFKYLYILELSVYEPWN